jgi:hypothetical protein
LHLNLLQSFFGFMTLPHNAAKPKLHGLGFPKAEVPLAMLGNTHFVKAHSWGTTVFLPPARSNRS